MFGRSKAEGGKEKKDEEGKARPVDKDAIHVVLAACSVDCTTSGSWDCSQVESEPEERDAVDCPMDDEMMRRWE